MYVCFIEFYIVELKCRPFRVLNLGLLNFISSNWKYRPFRVLNLCSIYSKYKPERYNRPWVEPNTIVTEWQSVWSSLLWTRQSLHHQVCDAPCLLLHKIRCAALPAYYCTRSGVRHSLSITVFDTPCMTCGWALVCGHPCRCLWVEPIH
jgi:hypothetical protein